MNSSSRPGANLSNGRTSILTGGGRQETYTNFNGSSSSSLAAHGGGVGRRPVNENIVVDDNVGRLSSADDRIFHRAQLTLFKGHIIICREFLASLPDFIITNRFPQKRNPQGIGQREKEKGTIAWDSDEELKVIERSSRRWRGGIFLSPPAKQESTGSFRDPTVKVCLHLAIVTLLLIVLISSPTRPESIFGWRELNFRRSLHISTTRPGISTGCFLAPSPRYPRFDRSRTIVYLMSSLNINKRQSKHPHTFPGRSCLHSLNGLDVN